jgi:hypothetical protein
VSCSRRRPADFAIGVELAGVLVHVSLASVLVVSIRSKLFVSKQVVSGQGKTLYKQQGNHTQHNAFLDTTSSDTIELLPNLNEPS